MAKKPKKKIQQPAADSDIETTIGNLRKTFGDDSIQYGESVVAVEAIPTGIACLDAVMGCVGMPRGRITEVYGNESGGKTTLCLHMVASCQSQGGIVAYIDAEHALDHEWATHIGVDMRKLLISQPNSGEQALDILQAIVSSGIVDMVIIDSVAALVPQEELDGELEDKQVGAQARMMSKAIRKLVSSCKKSRTAVIFVNQLRDKIGKGFSPGFMGQPEITPGGRALKFYSSIRMEVRRAETLREDNKPYGIVTKIKIAKNKVAPPFRSTELDIHHGAKFLGSKALFGVDKAKALSIGAVDIGAVEIRGSNYYLNGERLATGSEKFIAALRADKDLYQRVYDATYAAMISNDKPAKDTDSDKASEDDDINLDELRDTDD